MATPTVKNPPSNLVTRLLKNVQHTIFYWPKISNSTLAVLFFIGSLFLTTNALGQSPYTAIASGDWAADATWSGSGTPVAGDVVNIGNNFTVTIGTANAACATLNINNTGTLVLGGFSLTVSGVTTVGGGTSGVITTVTSGAGTKTFTGAVVVNAGATWNLSGQNPITSFGGGITMNGATFNNGTGATTFSATQSLLGASAMTFGGIVTINAGFTLTNSNTSTVTLSNTGVALAVGGAGSTFTQGSTGNTLSYAGSSIGVTNFNATGANNTVIYTAVAPTIRAVNYHNLTHSGTGTVTVAGISIAGNLTESSTGTFNLTGTTTFNGPATQTISGTGTFSFANITLNTSSSANVAVNQSISVSGTIAWSTNGLLVVNSSSNLTLGTAAAITSPGSARYIQLDGLTGTNSNLIRTTTNAVTQWQFTFPIGTSSGGYTPVVIPTIATAPANNATLSVKAIYNQSNQGQMRRTFRFIVAGNANATIFSNGVFNYNNTTDISAGDAESNYTTEWYLAASTATAAWTNIATIAAPTNQFTVAGGSVATASLTTGTYYYTIGQLSSYPNTWYSYQTGLWSNWQNWTSDPSGSTLVNGLNLPPQPGDEIVVLNGITITNDASGQVAAATTINAGGTLDMSTTTGNTLGTVSGSGTLRINGVALPTGTYTAFVASTGGTIEYYNTGGTLSTAQTTYNKLRLTATVGAPVFIMASNLTVNGTFDITTTGGTATWQINNNTANTRTIVLSGDLTVGANGRITVSGGTATAPHLLTMSGNLVNNGIIKFFDTSDLLFEEADYASGAIYTNALKGNAVNVTFSGTPDNTVTCNGVTDFYRFIVNKGTGQQAMLTVNSSATANFRLFGPANLGSASGAPNEISNNALSLVNGTLQLTGTITIPRLAANGTAANDYFSIPQNAGLWINGAGISVTVADNTTSNDDQRLLLDGLLRVSAGTFSCGDSRGINSGDAGIFFLEGGTVNAWQFRARTGGTDIFAYQQTGGTFNVGFGYGLDGGTDGGGNQARFDLSSATSSFQMSGGVLNIAKPTTTGGGLGGGIYIGSSAANFSVTGGTINAYTGLVRAGTEFRFDIRSTAPLFNLNILRESGTLTASLQAVAAAAGPPVVNAISGLTILNNLTLVDGTVDPTFVCNNLFLTVGGSFDIQGGTTFTPGTGVITFNGTGAQTWTHNGTITSLASVVMNKASGTLTLAGSGTFPSITTALTLASGTLADGGKTVAVTGTLSNSGTHSGAGLINYNNAGASTISGSGGTFGNLTITTNATIATAGNQTVTGNLRLVGANTTLNIASNSLTVLGNIYDAAAGTGVAFTASKRIQTSGLHNAGGLTRQGAAGDLIFPLGTAATTTYTPNTINVTATTHGLITVRNVNSAHPNVTTVNQSLLYYWRVTSTGYAGISAVAHNSYTYSAATEDAASANYRAARYNPTAFTWATSSTLFTTPAASAIPNMNTNDGTWSPSIGVQLDGEYTAGNLTAFNGTVLVYYSKASGAWNLTSTWSNASHTGTDASTAPPCATCPVVIGDGGSNNHTVTIDANSRSCGTLALNTGSTLDCSTFTGLNFGTNTGGAVTGRGTLRINNTAFPAGDFTNFIGANGGTVEWYGVTKTIPTTGPAPQNLSLATYYNLVTNPNAAATITLPASSLSIFNDFTQGNAAGFTGTTLTNGARTISINGSLTITRGTFNFSNVAASATTLTVGGNTSIASGASMAVVTGGTANTNTLTTPGGITNNGTINFNNTGVVNITFTGSSNVSFTGIGTPTTTLNLVTVNKGTSQTPTVTFSVPGTVNTTAVALGWLILTNGTFDFNSAATLSTTLSNSTYTIPATAKLKVTGSSNTVNITSSDTDASDLFLNGALEVAGGTVNVGSTGGSTTTNVDIEYGAAGTPTIAVSLGALNVKSSIRRSTSTLTGALVYNQTGGTVTVSGIDANTAPSNTRGVFEIDANTGSSFTLVGTGSLVVQRPTGGTGYADVFINPATSNVSSTSTLSVGLNGAAQTLRINIAPSIGNFTVIGGTSAQTVNMFSNPMVVAGTLSIQSPSVLVTNSLDVSVAGNLTINGTYTGGTNTTTFNGTGAQTGTLSSTSTFTNMTVNKTAGTTLTLSGTAPTLTNLNILNGILDVGSLALTINGNITNNSSQVGTGSISFASAATTHTITSSNGSFTNLSLGVSAAAPVTKTISVSGNTTILGTLDFTTFGTNRYLFIGSSLLTLGSSATVTNAGANRFVRTNGVSSDLGVARNWVVGTNSFTYPVGTRTNYTPVVFTSLVVTTAGLDPTYTVVPVDRQHPTANPIGEQILSYYWQVKRGSTLIHNTTGTLAFQVPTGLVGGSGGTLIGSYLDAINPLGWTAGGAISVSAPNTLLTFTGSFNTVLPATTGQFDYTYGTLATLPTPIAPVYTRFADADGISNPTSVNNLSVGGSWATAASWTLSATGNGAPLGAAPTSRPVVILSNARINLDILGQNAFTTQLSGLLVVSTTGHSIGSISGTGTLRTTTSTLPAGTYTTFTAAGGGTIEYAAAIPMNSRSTYNNLLISSPGVTMTNTDLVVNGNLTISAGNTLTNSFGNNISLLGNWTNNGTFSAGTTGAVTFTGNAAQTLGGSTATDFSGLTFNNSFGTAPQITFATNATATNALTMTAGIVNLAGNTITIGASGSASTLSRTASSSTNWVYGGTFCRFWPASTNVTSSTGNQYGLYPVGASTASSYRPVAITSSATPTGTGSYCVTHTSATTATDLSPTFFDTDAVEILRKHDAQFVTSSSVTGGTYDIGVTMTGLDPGSLSDIRLVVNTGATTAATVGVHATATGPSAANPTANRTGVALAELIGDFRIATTNIISTPLPIELISFTAALETDYVRLRWTTASELNNDFFTIERSADGEKYEPVKTIDGKGTSTNLSLYQATDEDPIPGVSYYRLKQTDFDGKSSHSEIRKIEFNENMAWLRVFPNPAVAKRFTIEVKGLPANFYVPIRVVSMIGATVHEVTLQTNASGTAITNVELDRIAPGVYHVVINAALGLHKTIIIQ